MDLKRISEMVAALSESRTVTELSVHEDGTRLTLRRALAVAPQTVSPASPAETEAPPTHIIRSPLVGIFHRRANEKQAPVTLGMAVQPGQVLGAIESMRMLYNVVADTAGVVADILVDDGQPVEYGQELFRLHPDARE